MLGVVEDEAGWNSIMNIAAQQADGNDESDEDSEQSDQEMEVDNTEDTSDGDLHDDDEDDDLGSPEIPIINGHHACVTHTLQLGINAALKEDTESKSFIQYVHSIMVFIKKSVVYSDQLKEKTNLDVILPGPTRWNATLDMINRFRQVFLFTMSNILGCWTF